MKHKWEKKAQMLWELDEYAVYGVPQTSGAILWFVLGPKMPGFSFMLRSEAKAWVEKKLSDVS